MQDVNARKIQFSVMFVDFKRPFQASIFEEKKKKICCYLKQLQSSFWEILIPNGAKKRALM